MSIADLKVRISANADRFDSTMKKMGKSFNKTVRKMERTGKNLTQKVTVPIGLMAAAAAKASIDFESAFAGVRKTVDATEAEFAGLRKGILDMSKVMPTSAGEIASVAEAAGQLGIQTDAILGFTETMVKLGDTTNLTAQEAATALARFANILQLPQDQFDEMGSTIVDLGNNFATTEAEITEFATRMAGAGSIAGLAASDIFGIAAAMSSVGVQAEAGGTAVQKVLIKMNTAVAESNDMLVKFADVAGMSAQEFQTAWREDAGQAFAEFVNGLGRQGDQAAGVLKELGLADQRLMRAFLSLANAGDLVNRTIGVGRDAWIDNIALTEEARKRYKTVASKLRVLRNRFVVLGISIGDALMPAIEGAISFVGKLTEAFENLSGIAKTKILLVAGLFAVGGPLMVGLSAVAAGISAISLPIAGVIAGLIGVSASIILLIGNWEALKERVQDLSWWRNTLISMTQIAIKFNPFALMTEGFIRLFEKISGINLEALIGIFGKKIFSEIADSLDSLKVKTDEFDTSIKGIGDSILSIIKNALPNLVNLFAGVGQAANDAGDAIDELREKRIKQFGEGIGKAGMPGSDMLVKDLSKMKAASQGFTSAWQAHWELNKTKWDKFIENSKAAGFDFVNFLSSKVAGGITSFAESIGMAFSGAENEFATGLERVLLLVVGFAKQLGAILISIGTAIAFIPGLQGTAGLYIAGGAALVAIATGVSARINKNRQERASGRDIGGPVMKDRPFLIGKGPHQELFIPERSGSIMPNSKLRGMGGGGLSEAAMARAFSSALEGAKLRVSGTDLVLVTKRGQNKLSR